MLFSGFTLNQMSWQYYSINRGTKQKAYQHDDPSQSDDVCNIQISVEETGGAFHSQHVRDEKHF